MTPAPLYSITVTRKRAPAVVRERLGLFEMWAEYPNLVWAMLQVARADFVRLELVTQSVTYVIRREDVRNSK